MNLIKITNRERILNEEYTQPNFIPNNVNYALKEARKNPSYDNLINLLRYRKAPLNEVLYTLEDCIDNETLDEGQIKTINRDFINVICDLGNLPILKARLENFQKRKNINMNHIIQEVECMINADRVIKNEKILERRFKINEFIRKYVKNSEAGVKALVEELCFMIDTLNCDKNARFNTAIENINYALYKNNVKYDEAMVTEVICRYFELSGVDRVEHILEINNIVDESTKVTVLKNLRKKSTCKVKELISKIKATEIKTPQTVKKVVRALYSQTPDQICNDIPNFLSWLRTFIVFSTVAANPYIGCVLLLVDQFLSMSVKRKEADRMINSFEAEKKKCEFKMLKLKNDKSKENLQRYINSLDKSLDKLRDYRDSLQSEEGRYNDMDEMTLEQKRHFDIMNEGVTGYKPYIVTPKEFKKIYNEGFLKTFDKVEDVFNRFSVPQDIEENVVMYSKDAFNHIWRFLSENGNLYVPVARISKNMNAAHHESLIKQLKKNINNNRYKIVEEDVNDRFSKLYIYTEYMIDTNLELVHEDVLKTCALIQGVKESMEKVLDFDTNRLMLRTNCVTDKNLLPDIATISSRLESISNRCMNEYMTETKNELYHQDKVPYMIIDNVSKAFETLSEGFNIRETSMIDLIDLAECLDSYNEYYDALNESGLNSVRNNVLMLREKLRKSAVKLSDKDKEYSKRVDNYFRNMSEKIQKNLTNKNREAVIRGSILPSASAVIKLAIASGATSLINPALGVITLLGGLGAAKIGTTKEKQYILDEIEIELKLVEKKISLAERNDDTKSLEQLYKIQKRLEREKTRIKFNKKDFRPIERR